MKRLIFALGLLLVPVLAFAQTPIATYKLQFFQAATPNPTLPTTLPFRETPAIPVAALACNQPPFTVLATPIQVNGATYIWDDPAVAMRLCTTNQAAWIAANLPPAGTVTTPGYNVTLTGFDANGVASGRALAQNQLTILPIILPPATPTGVQVR